MKAGKIIIGTALDDEGVLQDLEQMSKYLSKEDLEVVIRSYIDESGVEEEVREKISGLYEELTDAVKEYKAIANDPIQMDATKETLEDTKKRIQEIRHELEEITGEKIHIKGFDRESIKIEDINKSLNGVVSKVGRWGLALFGIRTAYSMIMKSVQQVSKNNDEVAQKVSLISNSLANLLAPVVEWIVDKVYTLLSYLNELTKEYLGIDLFANSEKNTKKTADNIKNTTKSAKELKKTLAGFDEMNVLTDNSTGGGGGSSSSSNNNDKDKVNPPADTSKIKAFVEEYQQMWEDILTIDSFEAQRLLIQSDSTWGLMKAGVFTAYQGIAKIINGIVNVFSGVLGIIIGIFKGDMNLILEGVKTLWKGIVGILEGIGEFVWGILETVVGAVYGVLKSIVEWIYKNAIKPIIDKISWLVSTGWNIISGLFTTVKNALSGAITKVKDTLKTMKDWIKTNIIDKVGKFFSDLWKGFKDKASGAWEGIKGIFSKFGDFFKTTFSNAWDKVKKLFSEGGKIFSGIKDGIVNAFKTVVNALISGINKVIAIPFKTINGLLNKIHDVDILGVKPFKSFWSRDPLSVPQIPKLAKGGVINMPGRGVAIGGESGKEGVIPLTDSQQMELLGEAIGRYIVINANITNTMNGRVISRELQKIQNESNFASNR